jgi:hypothetical protein
MKEQISIRGPMAPLRARSKAPSREPKPYLSHRPGLSGRLRRLRIWVRAVAA